MKISLLLLGLLLFVSDSQGKKCPKAKDAKLFITGGYGENSRISYTEIITLSNNKNNQGSSSVAGVNYPISVEGAVGVNFGDFGILVCGGMNETGITAECNVFKKNKWSSVNSMSIPRAFAWTIRLNAHQWWVTGGTQQGYDGVVVHTEIFDDRTGKFAKGTDLPEANDDHCIVMVNDTHAMLLGGNTPSALGYSNKTYFFNINTKVWTPAADLNTGRNGFSCGVFETCEGQKMVYAAGGYTEGYINTDTVEYYTPEGGSQGGPKGSWSFGPKLPAPLAYTVVADGDQLHMVGGVDVNGAALDTIHELNPEDLTWKVMPKIKLLNKRSGPSIVVL